MVAKTYDLNYGGYWREPNIGGLPAQSGVYSVYACTFDVNEGTVSLRKLLYIGESGDMRARIQGHEKRPTWRKELYQGEELCFNAALISPVSDRQRAEAALIYRHKPSCNDEYVNNFPFEETTVSTSGKSKFLEPHFTVYTTQQAGVAGLFSSASMPRRW